MSSKTRLLVRVGFSASTVISITGLLAVAGCNSHKDQLRPENLFSRLSGQRGQIIEPKKCMLRVAILTRSFRDTAINELAWMAADEQAIAPESRRALEVNGLKIGRITGALPSELEAVLEAPPPHKVEPASFLLDDGEQTLISLSDAVDQVSLFLNRDNRACGKDYQAASGYLRVTAQHNGSNDVSLRFTPEIHHGPIQRSYQPLTQATPYAPQQFKINDSQQEETLHDLAATLTLEPGQVAVVGCRPEQERSLGTFLFTQDESKGDQRCQRLILIWASRNHLGVLGDKPGAANRPVINGDANLKPRESGKTSMAAVRKGETKTQG